MAKSINNQPATSSSYKIEKGIPVTGMGRTSDAWKRYPLDKLKVGDSFLVPANDPNGKPHLVQPAVKNYNRVFNTTMALVSRLVDGGRRVWRTK